MSVSGLNCVESYLNCDLRSRSFFCDLSHESIEAFNKIKHAAVFPEHARVDGRHHAILPAGLRRARDDMLRFLKDQADAALQATQHLARDCSDAYGVARTIGLSHSVSERFARCLLETAADGEVSNGTVRVRLAMTHKEIRKLVGTSRETITRLLSEFRRNETAELKGSTLIIHNQPALKNMVRA